VANIKAPVVKLEVKQKEGKGRGKAHIAAPVLGQKMGVA